jgi:hypothetical protein
MGADVILEMKLTGVDGVIDTLNKLPAEIVSKRGGPALAALKKGAKVIDAARRDNLIRATSGATASGHSESIGLLLKSLQIKRGKSLEGSNGERVLLTVKRVTYPRSGDGKPVTTRKTGQLLEYGSEDQVAEPWVRPAAAAKAAEAITTVERELVAGIDRIVTKLAKTGGR